MRASYYVDRRIDQHGLDGYNRCSIQPDFSTIYSAVGHHATCSYSTGTTSSSST